MVEFPLIRCYAASASGFSLGVQYYFYMYLCDAVVFTCMRALRSGMPDFTTFGMGCDIVACSGAGENT